MLDSVDTVIAFAMVFTVVSLLVTITVQIITSGFNLRGHNLKCAVAEGLEALCSELGQKAEPSEGGEDSKRKLKTTRSVRLAERLLTDPLVSDNQLFDKIWLASAVRPQELFEALQRLVTRGAETDPVVHDAKEVLKVLGITTEVAAAAPQAQEADPTAKELLAIVMKRVTDKATLETLTADFSAFRASASVQARQALQEFESEVSIGIERAQEWFAMHARLITAALALVFTVCLQLDAVEIFKLASSNREFREKVVAQSAAVMGRAEQVLGEKTSVLDTGVQASLASLSADAKKSVDQTKMVVHPGETRFDVQRRLDEALGKLEPGARNAAMKAFDAAVSAAVEKEIKKNAEHAAVLQTSLASAGFDLFPKTWFGRWKEGTWPEHIPGMFFSILLLSLGAPFWFNLLRNLASLRSVVASNIGSAKAAVTSSSRPPAARDGAGAEPEPARGS